MAGSINKVILVGNLGADPEVKRTQSGTTIVNLSIATSESWRDRTSGERKEKTEWHRVVIFNEGLCKVAEQFLRKGSKVYLEGQLQTRSWEDQSGQKRYSTEVVLQNFNSNLTMLDGPGGGAPGARGGASQGGGYDGMPDYGNDGPAERAPAARRAPAGGGGRSAPPAAPSYGDLDDEIPF